MNLLSGRASKTASVVLMPSALEDPLQGPPGLLRLGVFLLCAAISTFFGALVVAFFWRSQVPSYWQKIPMPPLLWVSTNLILSSSVTFETGRRLWRLGRQELASKFILATACLGVGFLASQVTAWRVLVGRGAYLSHSPWSSFFYIFTGLHALHLLGGLIALFILIWGRKRREWIDATCYYWHFMGILWIALFYVLVNY